MQALPAVSVLIRSTDRPTLRQALDSVAAQTYPNAEVLVIAAKPQHGALPQQCGPYPLRLVPTDAPLPRSRAANKALAEARGELLIFLDDDDWLMPSHLERLARSLHAQPWLSAAYTGVATVDDAGTPLGQAMDVPFDRIRQLAGNYTPIHAVMFRRALLARGLRFDEALDHYEDWDFWLQVAACGPLAHLPGVSAAYRIHTSSGVHEAQAMHLASRRIYAKWQSLYGAGEIAGLMERVWLALELQPQLDATRQALDDTRRAVEKSQADVRQLQAALEQQRADFTGSMSWKVTAPLRWLVQKIKRT